MNTQNNPTSEQILEWGAERLDEALIAYVNDAYKLAVITDNDGSRYTCLIIDGRVALVIPEPSQAPTCPQ